MRSELVSIPWAGARARGRSERRLLAPLVPLYAAALSGKNAAYDHGWLRSRRLQGAVISVGNLSVGGAGKTPLVIRLAELLAARGFAVDVLSRGYGRRSHAVERVEPDAGPSLEAAALRYGDEPLLIAQATGVPVYVGADRYQAGLLAERRPVAGPRVHLLDDGFQHRQLARAIDVVVLHRGDFEESLLPGGRLREPLSALHRATIAVLRVEDASFEPVLRRRGFTLPVWWMTREILPPVGAALAPALAFCGIAHCSEFFQSLRRLGIELTATHSFHDHHQYTDDDIAVLRRSLSESGASALLTTEKDLVRLSISHRSELRDAAPLHAVPLRARILVEEAAVAQLLELAGLPQFAGPGA